MGKSNHYSMSSNGPNTDYCTFICVCVCMVYVCVCMVYVCVCVWCMYVCVRDSVTFETRF